MNKDIFNAVANTPTYIKLNEKTIEIEGELWSVTIHGIDGINVFLTSVKTDHCVMSMLTPEYDKGKEIYMNKEEIKERKTAQYVAQQIASRVTEELKTSVPVVERFNNDHNKN